MLVETLAFATAVQVVATASALSMTAIVPLVAVRLGIGPDFVGYQVSLIYLSGMIVSAFSGRLIARYGAATIEQLCLVTFALALLCFAGGRLDLLVLGSLVLGIGYGLQNPAASQLLAAVTPAARRNLVFSIKQAGVPLGGILASLAVPAAASLVSWRLALALAASIPMVVLVALRRRIEHVPAASAAPTRGFLAGQALLRERPALAHIAAIGFCFSTVQLSLSVFAVTTLVKESGWALVGAGAAAALMQFAGALGRISWGMVADRLGGGIGVLALLGTLGGFSTLALWLSESGPAWVQVILFFILGAVWLGWNGVLLGETARFAPAERVGEATGAVLVYFFLGVIVGPTSFALVARSLSSFGAAFALYSLMGFLGAVVALRLRQRDYRSSRP